MTSKILAADVERLLNDSTFIAILNKVRSDQITAFTSSTASEVDVRENAHQILRALDKIEAALRSVITDEAIKEKREGRSR